MQIIVSRRQGKRNFFGWAFNRNRGKEIRKHWKLIPSDIDVLITHSPPYGILDTTKAEIHDGCEDLLKAVKQSQPKYHPVGHIHEAYGRMQTIMAILSMAA